uniref:Uncharacterized protein n=1 Tax=Avena sativa TaxID=4498 RepID=A0ACD5X441_AVESA
MQNPHPSYAHHQLQQHLASLLSAAAGEPPHPSDDASRAAALSSLRLSLLHPPNRPLLPSLAPFLAPPLSVLLADDASYAVRRAAVASYAALSAVLCAHEAPGGLPDGFVAWALPLLGEPASSALVAEGLRELLATGDVPTVERFVPPLLAACRDVLEDDRTSLAVLRCLLGLLTLVAAKFPHCFRPQFVDIVDLLLGWLFVPDLADTDCCTILDSFSQFQWHWLGNLQFSLGLLPKFLADMEVLVHDPNLAASHNSGRLRPLFACFSTVLQIMASGVAERNNFRELVVGPLEGLAPQLLRCASVIASKLGWSERMEEASRCLVLLAEILQERFAEFYVRFVDVLTQGLDSASSLQLVAALKTNLQVLSLQNLGLCSSAVEHLLDFSSLLSRTRLHPNHNVVCNDAVIHYCSSRLLDLGNLAASSLKDSSRIGGATESHHAYRARLEIDILKVLRHASLALCRCHETDALVGLQRWAVSTFYTYFEQEKQLTRGLSDTHKHFSWMSGLIYQSQGQYEKAAAHYSHLLQSEEALTSMESDVIQYIIARVIECYTALSDWKCLEGWLAELQELRAVHAGKPYSGALTSAGNELNAIHAMACFDEGDFHSAWSYLDLTPKSSSELTLDPKVALERSELMLLRAMLQSDSKSDRAREELGKTRGYTLRALLYLLHIILNYGVELKQTVESGLSTVPLLPWQDIIPQLFARLSSHPEKIIRKQLESILVKLGKLSPYSIVYPTLVDINACEGEPSEELQRILNFLVKLYPKLIKDVKLAIDELGMITVLWEEQWLSTLQDLHSDVLRRISILKEEAARVASNSTLTSAEKNKINAAKYSAIMTPIVVALERRLASTSREPRTPHETWFHKEYNAQLRSAITSLKVAPGSPASLGEIWRPFDTIAASLATHQRKSRILLSEIAPQLAALSTSDIPMPGFEKQILDSSESSFAANHGTITVSSFCKEVTILSTKTRPKKLILQGSDGQKYIYLLKGREDLRLDSRIMQLLEAINSFLYSSSDTRSRNIAIRFYSVTPISGRAGLIQWVENVSSIYNVYKSWQKRSQVAHAQLSSVSNGNAHNPVPHVPRPSDMFYGKIIPALKEKGIKRVISRRDWPLDVKKKVLLELMKETPKQILWQEMWCSSEGFKNFNSKVKRFSSSLAAMSMVGHILGLGDRHLDNILMDFSNGDVVHIDYNICFDKGKRLKIPEIVPFRLTQTMESALGLAGFEGVFRVTCEAVMDALLKNKDIILMLMEVFVWDPLIEWTRGNMQDEAGIAGEEKKGMELAVSLSLFSSRIQESRVPLQEHQDLFVTNLPATLSVLKKFLDSLDQYEVMSAMFYHAEKERSSALHKETSAKSILAEATSVAEKSRSSFELHSHELAEAKTAAVDEANTLAIWVEKHGRVLEAIRDNSITGAELLMQLNSKDEALSLVSAVLVSGVPLTVVPEPTREHCYELDREVSELITELHAGRSSALEALGEYALVLQQVLPVNYITTSPITGWAQSLQLSVTSTSQDMLSLAKRQAAEVIAKVQGEGSNLVQQRYLDLLNQMESYVACVERITRECSELMNSVGLNNEAQSKDRILSAFMNFVQLPSQKNDDDNIPFSQEVKTPAQEEVQEKTSKVLSILGNAVSQLYSEVRARMSELSTKAVGISKFRTDEADLQADAGMSLQLFDQQIEKFALISGFVNEVHEVIGIKLAEMNTDYAKHRPGQWAYTFQAILHSSTNMIEQMTEVLLPEIIRSFVSYNSEVMEAFGSISRIRGSVDTALEKLAEVELERASLTELEQSYFMKVGRITEQQAALEEAAMRGRDHLSWEEAEELASQEEACRAQLEQLQKTWSQKDMRISSLMKVEANVMNSLFSSEQYFSSLVNVDQESEFHLRSKALLSILIKPFADLESLDHMLSSRGAFPSHMSGSISNLRDVLSTKSSLSDVMWPLSGLLKDHAFFVWKLGLLDSVLDLCMHEISSSVEHSCTTNQLYTTLKKKLAIHVEKQVGQYILRRIAPALILHLDKEICDLLQSSQGRRESGQPTAAVGRVASMLEEYCNAHETARAARTAVSLMQRQLNDLTEALRKIVLEIVQVEWLHDLSSPHAQKAKIFSQNILNDDKFMSMLLNISRRNLLDKIQSSVSLVTRSIECLQACESTSCSAEGQLERAMGWACAGPNTSGAGGSTAKGSGIPPEFHDHLLKRRKLLGSVQEQASDLVKSCTSVLEFEASRDGLYFVSEDKSSGQSTDNGRAWQQTFLNLLTRLDAAYHSFTCAEQEWKLGKLNMETAGKGLYSASNQLSAVSVNAKSALVNLQDTLVDMYERACEVSVSLSGFKHISQDRTALTAECGSLLEEVLAIAEGLHDVYTLGKEASVLHSSLTTNISKANTILLPLEALLSADVAVMSEAISKEREKNNTSMPLIHGKALYQSYITRVREACKNLEPLVPLFTEYVKELHSMVIRLGRLSSLHAGNLHKALEVLEESETVRSQDMPSARPDILESDSSIEKDKSSSGSREGASQDLVMDTYGSLQDECWISPPEHSYTSSSGCTTGLTQLTSELEQIDALLDSKPGIEGPGVNSQETRDGRTDSESDSSSNKQTLLNNVTLTQASNAHEAETSLGEGRIETEDNIGAFKQVRGQECDSTDNKSYSDTRTNRGKNPFALSILKQLEHKLHGRDIDGTRSLKISEQVDHLLKQATSIDNLCNMYEGWTPWI